MAKLDIVYYGNPILRNQSEVIEKIDDELREFINEMFITLKRSKGLGLSAPQVGVNKKLFILDMSSVSLEHDKMVFINPKIVFSSNPISGEEGCLSFPGLYLDVSRATEVECEYTDLNGVKQRIHANDLLARAIQHENDHLNGVLFIDHISPADRQMIAGRLKKIKAG